jgi:hypothetical protein
MAVSMFGSSSFSAFPLHDARPDVEVEKERTHREMKAESNGGVFSGAELGFVEESDYRKNGRKETCPVVEAVQRT